MTKATGIASHAIVTTAGYIFLGYVAVHHWGWLDGLAAIVTFNTFVGAVRTKTTWADIYPESTQTGSKADSDG